MCRPVGRAGLGRGGACGYSREGADRGRPGACRLAKLVRARRATLTAASAACSVPVYGSCAQHGWGGHTCGGLAQPHIDGPGVTNGPNRHARAPGEKKAAKPPNQAFLASTRRIDDHARPSKAKFCGTQPSYNNFPCDNLQNDASPRRCHARLTTAICRKNPTLGGAGERASPAKKSQLTSAHAPKTTDAERWTHATAAHPPTRDAARRLLPKNVEYTPAQGHTRTVLR